MKRFLFLVGMVTALTTPTLAYAATLSFSMQEASVSIGEPFVVSVILDTENAVNAVEAVLAIPSGFEFQSASDGNTIVSLWVERPRYDRETRWLAVSGIIPGGFLGTGQLLKFTLKAEATGSIALSFDRTRTAVYRNSPDGTPESTTLRSLMLNVKVGTTAPIIPVADTEPPEAFTPVVTRDPLVYDGAWTLLFATQDKGSGIARYEVSESPSRQTYSNKLGWTKAESPYRLAGEMPARYIYVRAVDEQGNIRTALYTPAYSFSWLEGITLGILMIALVLFVLRRQRKKQYHASS